VNTWKTLYIKEIKDNRTLFVLLPLVTVFLELVAVQSFDDGQPPSLHFLWSFVPYAFLLILPFVLSHSFAQEVKGQTHYLLLSLPVSRTQIFAAKAAAVATLGIVLFALSTAGLIAVVGELHALAIEAEKTASHALSFKIPPFSDIWVDLLVISGMFYLSALALLLGIASGTAGLKLVVRRFAGLASTAFILGVLYFYFSILPDVLDLPEIFGTYELTIWSDYDGPDEPIDISPESIEVNFMFLAYSVFVGLASMGIGMWLVEKRAEA
jgi:hypothetical protein